jgi:hypothetical protein
MMFILCKVGFNLAPLLLIKHLKSQMKTIAKTKRRSLSHVSAHESREPRLSNAWVLYINLFYNM